MSSENWTGLDPVKSKESIESFYNESETVMRKFEGAFIYLFDNLKECWASINAVTFSGIYSFKVEGVLDQFAISAYGVCVSATTSYNFLVDKIGGERMQFGESRFKDKFPAYVFLKVLDGKIGMNTTEVKDVILPNFEKKIGDAINSLNSLPKTIQFYDVYGKQQNSYDNGIGNMQNNITVLVEEMKDAIKEATEKEVDNVELGAKQSDANLSEMSQRMAKITSQPRSGDASGGSVRKERIEKFD